MPGPDKAQLLKRWSDLAGHTDEALETGEDLLARWSEPHRRYHTVTHLAAVLDHLRWLGSDAVATALAAWYHDAVYRPERSDNEQASATLAMKSLTRLGYGPDVTAETTRLVLLTQTHDPDPGDLEGQRLCDADLSILGSEPAIYDRYRHAVLEEYSWLSPQAWAKGRLAVLEGLRARTGLFSTEKGHHRWEAAARSNIRAELDSLKGA